MFFVNICRHFIIVILLLCCKTANIITTAECQNNHKKLKINFSGKI